MQSVDSLEKTLMLGGIGGRRRRGQQRMRQLDGIINSMDVSLSELRAFNYANAFDCVDHNKLWKILKDMRIPDHLTCLLKNLCAGQEAS